MSIKLNNPYFNINYTFLEKDIPALKNYEWTKGIRRRVPLFMDGYRYAHQAVKKLWGLDFFFFEVGREQVKSVFLSESLNKEAAEIWWEKMKTDKDFACNIVAEFKSIVDIAKNLAASISTNNNTPKDLKKYMLEHLNWWVKFFELALLWFCVDNMKIKIDELITKSWKESKDELKHFLENVYRPKKMPLSSVEQRDILNICQMKKSEQKEAIKIHYSKYRHLSLHNIDDEYFDLKYYQDRLKALSNKDEYEKEKNHLGEAEQEIKEADKLIENANLSSELKEKIEFVRWFMYLRTETIDYFMLVNGAYKPILDSLSQIFNLPSDAVLHMTYEEIISSLEKGSLTISKDLILDRTNNWYAFLIAPNGSYFVTGKEIDELFDIVVPNRKIEKVDEIKGQVAYKWKVKAKARVIIDRRNAHELQEGEILVTTMTSPEFVSAMKISSGIITNEGGILCHAAIMSREFKKPCIIGTKIATDTIKTGQILTLDADNGIIYLKDN